MVHQQFPDVHVIANNDNVGFGRANNQAIRAAQGRYLLILNPDTIIQEDTLTSLVAFMEAHPEAGAAGPEILNPDGTFAPESRRSFPTPTVAFYRMVGLSRLFPQSPRFGRYNLSYLPIDAVAEVDALSGSCMFVRHDALREQGARSETKGEAKDTPSKSSASEAACPEYAGAGLFDEDFFMYGEDLDWCYRIQQAGWAIYYTPDTKIIHYKGESTKKGELRYVRVFYGAMILFIQKHLGKTGPSSFERLMRLGIWSHASLTVVNNTVRRLAAPFIDVLLTYGLVTLLGALYLEYRGFAWSPRFLLSVAPAYALGSVLGIGLLGGYRYKQRQFARPIMFGVGLGFLLVVVLSFFLKSIAFSRFVVGISYPLGVLLLLGWRRIWYARSIGVRQALLVGSTDEARRLRRLLVRHPNPPFELIGYILPPSVEPPEHPSSLPLLGRIHHLRDLVRLERLDDVIFASSDLTHRDTFGMMQRLRDLPVQFRMFGEDQEHVIGKASVADLSAPELLDAPLERPRTVAARRAFEIPMAIIGLLLLPFVWLLNLGAKPTTYRARLLRRLRQSGSVLSGRRALIGYHEHERSAFCPPDDWELPTGIFSITDTLGKTKPNKEELGHAYWFYVSHQSASLDWDIMTRALRNLK